MLFTAKLCPVEQRRCPRLGPMFGQGGSKVVGGVHKPNAWKTLIDLGLAHPIAATFLVALVARLVVIFLLSHLFTGSLVTDDRTYHVMAMQKATGDTAGWDDFTHTLYWSTATFMVPITFLYRVFGPNILWAQLLVAVVGALAAALVMRLASEFVSRRMAIASGAVVALLPSQVLWSSLVMKDAFVWLCLICLALCVALSRHKVGWSLLPWAGLAGAVLGGLAFLRLHTLVVASWALVAAALVGTRKEGRVQRTVGALVLAISIPWVLGDIGPGGYSLVVNAGSLEDRRFQNAAGAKSAFVDPAKDPNLDTESEPSIDEDSERIAEILAAAESEREKAESAVMEAKKIKAEARAVAQQSGSGPTSREARRLERRAARLLELSQQRLAAAARLESEAAQRESETEQPPAPPPSDTGVTRDLRHLPTGVSVMLLEPFPLPFEGSASLRMARLESLVWYPVLALALLGLVYARRRLREIFFPVLVGTGMLLLYALTEGNVGTAHRHRGEFIWVAALLAGFGLQGMVRRKSSAQVVPETSHHRASLQEH